jgi:hypothetical protein
MEINPEPLPFKRKLFTEEAASTSVAEVKIKDFKEPYQTVSFNFLTVECIINYKLIYNNNNNSFNSLCPIMKSLKLPGNNKTR